MRRAQITLVVIFGIIILLLLSIPLFNIRKASHTNRSKLDIVFSYIESCFEDSLSKAAEEASINEIGKESCALFQKCMDTDIFEKQGIIVEYSSPECIADITENGVVGSLLTEVRASNAGQSVIRTTRFEKVIPLPVELSPGETAFDIIDNAIIIEIPIDPDRIISTRPSDFFMKTSAWAELMERRDYKLYAAVNANFYHTGSVHGPAGGEGDFVVYDLNTNGIFVVYNDGGIELIDLWDKQGTPQMSLIIDKMKEKGIREVVSGQPVLVTDCEPRDLRKSQYNIEFLYSKRPRTVIGINYDTGKLYFVILIKASLIEAGEFLAEEVCKCSNSVRRCSMLNLDGGGSTTLWKEGQLVFSGDIYEGRGAERTVANHIAIKR